MLVTEGSASRARWAVMWVASNGRSSKVVRKNFGDDYASAEKLYLKAVAAGKRAATLACVNMGFPPPVELRPRTVRKKGRVKGSRKVRIVEVQVSPLREMNQEGKLWCPYCRKVRTFVLKRVSDVDGIKFANPKYVCPICQVSNSDHHVRYWNPSASIHMESSLTSMRTRTRAPRTAPTRRRRRR